MEFIVLRVLVAYQGCIDFVHDVEWSGLVVVESEHKGQRRQRLLAAGKIADILPVN